MNKNGSSNTFDDRMGSLKDSVRNLVDAGEDRANYIKDRVVDAKGAAIDKGSAALGRISALVKEHPFAAIGIALGIGYVAIRMLRR